MTDLSAVVRDVVYYALVVGLSAALGFGLVGAAFRLQPWIPADLGVGGRVVGAVLAAAGGGASGGAVYGALRHVLLPGVSLLTDGVLWVVATGVGSAVAGGLLTARYGPRAASASSGGRMILVWSFGLGGLVGGGVGGVLQHLL